MVAMSSDYRACSATNRMYDALLSQLPITLILTVHCMNVVCVLVHT